MDSVQKVQEKIIDNLRSQVSTYEKLVKVLTEEGNLKDEIIKTQKEIIEAYKKYCEDSEQIRKDFNKKFLEDCNQLQR